MVKLVAALHIFAWMFAARFTAGTLYTASNVAELEAVVAQANYDQASWITVQLAAGTYELASPLVISRPMNISGASGSGKALITLGSTFMSPYGDTKPLLFIMSSGVNISALQLKNTRGYSAVQIGSLLNGTAGFGPVVVHACEFSGNTVATAGAAMFVYDKSHAIEVIVSSSIFSNNQAADIGGALMMECAGCDLRLLHTAFINNTAYAGGGAVAVTESSSVNITGCNFTGNAATKTEATEELPPGSGGGVVVLRSVQPVLVGGCRFVGNRAQGSGGGVLTTLADLTVLDSLFVGNRAGALSRAAPAEMYNYLSARAFNVTDCEVGYTAPSVGGGLASMGRAQFGTASTGRLFVANSTFVDNTATSCGGAVGTLVLRNVTLHGNAFANNWAGMRGGAVQVTGDTEYAQVTLSHFSGNTAGGLPSALTSPDDFDLYANSFGKGGAVRLMQVTSTAVVISNVFVRNTALGQGGALSVEDNNLVLMISSVFVSNAAGTEGGGMVVLQATLYAYQSSFYRNSAGTLDPAWESTSTGGAVHGEASSIVFDSGFDFDGNWAVRGGALAGVSCKTVVLVAQFDENPLNYRSPQSAIDDWYGSDSTLRDNLALWRGTALAESDAYDATYGSGGYSGYGGPDYGSVRVGPDLGTGVMQMLVRSRHLELAFPGNRSYVTNNTAILGGAVYGHIDMPMLIAGYRMLIANNSAVSGGAFNFYGTTATMVQVPVYNNSATRAVPSDTRAAGLARTLGCGINGGGGVCVSGFRSYAVFASVFLIRNAAAFGGGLYSTSSSQCDRMDGCYTLPLYNCTLVNNTAVGGGGGGVFWVYPGNLAIACRAVVRPEDQAYVLTLNLDKLNGTFINGFPNKTQSCPAPEWEGNAAIGGGYGPTIASTAFGLSGPAVLDKYSSNTDIHVDISVLDYYGQQTTSNLPDDPNSMIVLADHPQALQQTLVSTKAGVAPFTSLRLRTTAGSVTNILFVSLYGLRSLEPANVTVEVRSCIYGEFLAAAGDECLACSRGYWNLNTSAYACETCPDNAFCSDKELGGGIIVPDMEYYHSNIFSEQVHGCPNPESCSWTNRTKFIAQLQSFFIRVMYMDSTGMVNLNEWDAEQAGSASPAAAPASASQRRAALESTSSPRQLAPSSFPKVSAAQHRMGRLLSAVLSVVANLPRTRSRLPPDRSASVGDGTSVMAQQERVEAEAAAAEAAAAGAGGAAIYSGLDASSLASIVFHQGALYLEDGGGFPSAAAASGLPHWSAYSAAALRLGLHTQQQQQQQQRRSGNWQAADWQAAASSISIGRQKAAAASAAAEAAAAYSDVLQARPQLALLLTGPGAGPATAATAAAATAADAGGFLAGMVSLPAPPPARRARALLHHQRHTRALLQTSGSSGGSDGSSSGAGGGGGSSSNSSFFHWLQISDADAVAIAPGTLALLLAVDELFANLTELNLPRATTLIEMSAYNISWSNSMYEIAQCADGYFGVMCSQCKSGYGSIDVATCRKCPKAALNNLYYSLIVLLTVVGLAITIRATLQSMEAYVVAAREDALREKGVARLRAESEQQQQQQQQQQGAGKGSAAGDCAGDPAAGAAGPAANGADPATGGGSMRLLSGTGRRRSKLQPGAGSGASPLPMSASSPRVPINGTSASASPVASAAATGVGTQGSFTIRAHHSDLGSASPQTEGTKSPATLLLTVNSSSEELAAGSGSSGAGRPLGNNAESSEAHPNNDSSEQRLASSEQRLLEPRPSQRRRLFVTDAPGQNAPSPDQTVLSPSAWSQTVPTHNAPDQAVLSPSACSATLPNHSAPGQTGPGQDGGPVAEADEASGEDGAKLRPQPEADSIGNPSGEASDGPAHSPGPGVAPSAEHGDTTAAPAGPLLHADTPDAPRTLSGGSGEQAQALQTPAPPKQQPQLQQGAPESPPPQQQRQQAQAQPVLSDHTASEDRVDDWPQIPAQQQQQQQQQPSGRLGHTASENWDDVLDGLHITARAVSRSANSHLATAAPATLVVVAAAAASPAAGAAAVGGGVGVAAVGAPNGCDRQQQQQQQQRAEPEQAEREEMPGEGAEATIIKIFVSYMQVLAMVRNVPLTYPAAFTSLLGIINQVTAFPGTMVSLDCSLPEVGVSKGIVKVLIASLAPVYVIAFMSVFWLLRCAYLYGYAHKRNRVHPAVLSNGNGAGQAAEEAEQLSVADEEAAQLPGGPPETASQYVKRRLLLSFIVIVFYLYPNTVVSLLNIFACDAVDDDTENGEAEDMGLNKGTWWQQDFGVQCMEGPHALLVVLLGVPGLVLIAFGWPILSAGWLWRNRRSLEDRNFMAVYSFMYAEYELGGICPYWESVIMARKLAVSAVVVFMAQSPLNQQLLVTMGILVAALALQLIYEPYDLDLMDALERLSLLATLATLYLSMFLIGNISSAGNIIMSTALIAVNVGTVAIFIFCLVREYYRSAMTAAGLGPRDPTPTGREEMRKVVHERLTEHFGEGPTRYLAPLVVRVKETEHKLSRHILRGSLWQRVRVAFSAGSQTQPAAEGAIFVAPGQADEKRKGPSTRGEP